MKDFWILLSQIFLWGVVALFVLCFLYACARFIFTAWFRSKEEHELRFRPYDFSFDEEPREEEENTRGN